MMIDGMNVQRLITEYLVQPFPEMQPDYWLKIEIRKVGEAYVPTLYVLDRFRLCPSGLMQKHRRRRKSYRLWVEDSVGLWPEGCTICGAEEAQLLGIILDILNSRFHREPIPASTRPFLHGYDEGFSAC